MDVVGALRSAISWLIQVIGEKLLTDQMDQLRSRVGLEDNINSLKLQLRKAYLVLGAAQGMQITNEYLLLSLVDLERLVYAAEKMLYDLGSCGCIRSSIGSEAPQISGNTTASRAFTDGSSSSSSSSTLQVVAADSSSLHVVVARAKRNFNFLTSMPTTPFYFSERSIIPHPPNGAISCDVCSGAIDKRVKRRKLLAGVDSSHRMSEITNKLREIGDHVHGALELEIVGSLSRGITQGTATVIGATVSPNDSGVDVAQLGEFSQPELLIISTNHQTVESDENSSQPMLEDKKLLHDLPISEALESLNLHSDTELLDFIGYSGFFSPRLNYKFSVINLRGLHLKDFMNLKVLPPLGQLRFLKRLYLDNFLAIKEVTSEFYGSGAIMGFPSLEELTFRNMRKCETWVGIDNCEIFPYLKKLTLKSCCKLRNLPYGLKSSSGNGSNSWLHSLMELHIYSCPELVLPAFPHAHILYKTSVS